jgi:uncharacterized protein (TIGR02145 family)/uncharacterized repeat protein (TIGR02543 family)
LDGDFIYPPAPAIENPLSYTVEDAAITLTNPTKKGFNFAGWTGSNGETKTLSVSVAKGSTGNKSFTANWTWIPTFVDERDDRVYKKVLIGEQVWMGENLDYVGDDPDNPIGVCLSNLDENCEKYARLYTLTEARSGASASALVPSGVQGACPVGWHLPSQGEWNILMTSIGGLAMTNKMKSTEYWSAPGTDDYGFSALPSGGIRQNSLAFEQNVFYGWTTDNTVVWSIWNVGGAQRLNLPAGVNYGRGSIRCVEDVD